ncbi:MAG: BrnT family toxin [Anaerolineales bacterium]|jgi:hypothetical protein|nr:BrnT family toxin [Anaerolineales bacterium]
MDGQSIRAKVLVSKQHKSVGEKRRISAAFPCQFMVVWALVNGGIIWGMIQVYEWDQGKARVNLQKHKVSFEEAETVFDDPFLFTLHDKLHSDEEDRYISIGTSKNMRVLLVVHVERLETEKFTLVRIISCRKATPVERRLYEENK